MIDLLNPSTYGADVEAALVAGEDVMRGFVQHELARDDRCNRGLSLMRESNPYYADREDLRATLVDIIEGRDLLAFHYSRMTDTEVATVLKTGFQPTSLQLLRERLDRQVEESVIPGDLAERVFASSPLQFGDAYGHRVGLFWMAAPASSPASTGVHELLGNWGGEVAYWNLEDDDASAVRAIGKGRIFSVAVPLTGNDRNRQKVVSFILTSAMRRLDGAETPSRYDFCVEEPIGPDRILSVVSEGEAAYQTFGSHDDEAP